MPLKTCTKCQQPKDADLDFHRESFSTKPRARCKLCTNAENIARAAANPEKHNARSKAWRQANPERWMATVRAWNARNPEKLLANSKRYQYGVNFDALWDSQGGLCASCQKPMQRVGKGPDSASVDHDRSCCSRFGSCGECVRGLIHHNCNLLLGYAKDDIDVLKGAIAYLERWQQRPDSQPSPDSSYQGVPS